VYISKNCYMQQSDIQTELNCTRKVPECRDLQLAVFAITDDVNSAGCVQSKASTRNAIRTSGSHYRGNACRANPSFEIYWAGASADP
jgi:hypothetical protein